MLSFIPKKMADHTEQVSVSALKRQGIALVMLDFDNTIVPYTTSEPTPEMDRWLKDAMESGVQMCVVSNSKKPRVQLFCARYGLPCMTKARKPGGRGIRAALAEYHCRPQQAALIGDQIFTDVLGANRAGVCSILIRPIKLHNIWLKLRNIAEQPFILIGKWRCSHEKS
ncbi:MAG: YqeG family HAD IIIA-type phosphatase [Oscillospiraceae bacterium]|nr:YqeG family HAD IIIA-type phosphatase [Oscillospiraceae bacterium]